MASYILARRWLYSLGLLLAFLISLPFQVQAQIPAFNLSECEREEGERTVFGAECGTLTLAENPQQSNARQLDIFVMRIPAIRKSDKPPIFFIHGGPGAASSQLAQMARIQFASWLKDHDFVFVDQRGTGKSHPLNCDFNALQYSALSPDNVQQHYLNSLKSCVAELDADFVYYTTPYAVMDLEQVRQALGYNKIQLWGGSYGTRVILEYLRQHSNTIDRAVLDGVAPILMQLPVHANDDASFALHNIFEQCANDPACQKAFGNLQAHWLTLLQQLREKSITIDIQHPRTQEKFTVYLNDEVLTGTVRAILYQRETSSILPLAIHRAVQGDYSVLASVAFLGQEQMNEMLSEVMHLAVLCNEDLQVAKTGKAIAPAKFSPLITALSQVKFSELCSIFPTFTIDPAYFEPFKSAVPSILLSGNYDPITQPRWAEVAAKNLTNVQHIVVEGAHHGVSPIGCIPDILEDFYNGATLPLDTDCIKTIQPHAFFIDSAGPALQTPDKAEAQGDD